MKRERVVFLGERVIVGEEIDPDELPDREGFRRQAARWGGPEDVLILRNARLEEASAGERIDYLMIRRSEISALGIGMAAVEGFGPASVH
ncbi:hypothetical protein [Calidithermus roseus]|uniref:Uncharacterized protein n=1 Tax=Calidithermus roseus TaxID=1644118 RepID=A0A399EPN6_9DEIN|nr:hypothetical protein [Calidithermus roseus]RIH85506.1 hypothetical protein Mrose_02180 [Calidithermus roseus]